MPEFVLRLLGRTRTRFFDFCQQVELPRKIWHASSIGGVGLINKYLEDWSVKLMLIWGALILGLLYEWVRTKRRIPLLHHLEREREAETRTAVVDFLVACAICVTLFPERVVTTALFITAVADPAAAFVGQASLAKKRWRHRPKKCVEGTIACAGFAFLIAGFCYQMQHWPLLLFCGVACSIAELNTKQRKMKRGPFKGHLTPADHFYIIITAALSLSVVELLLRQ